MQLIALIIALTLLALPAHAEDLLATGPSPMTVYSGNMVEWTKKQCADRPMANVDCSASDDEIDATLNECQMFWVTNDDAPAQCALNFGHPSCGHYTIPSCAAVYKASTSESFVQRKVTRDAALKALATKQIDAVAEAIR